MLSPYIVNVSFAVGLRMSATAWMLKTLRAQICWIDLAFFKRDLDDGLYDLSKLPKMINLTIINCGAKTSGVPEAGTWVYTDEVEGDVQYLAYDYYGYYTDDSGYQLSLVDFDYVAQPGDTWYSIARRHGMPVVDLLALNRAIAEDRIFAGQVVRIA